MAPGLWNCPNWANVQFRRVILSMDQSYTKKHLNSYTVWTSMAHSSGPSDTGAKVAIQAQVCGRIWKGPSQKLSGTLKHRLCFLCRYSSGDVCVPGNGYTQRPGVFWG